MHESASSKYIPAGGIWRCRGVSEEYRNLASAIARLAYIAFQFLGADGLNSQPCMNSHLKQS